MLMILQTVHFSDNPALREKADKYVTLTVDAGKVIKSWKASLFSFEWLTPEGHIRPADDLPMRERDRRLEVEKFLAEGMSLERPVLGIGLMDNVEIGSGRAVFLTLASLGHTSISVHIPKSCEKEFGPYRL